MNTGFVSLRTRYCGKLLWTVPWKALNVLPNWATIIFSIRTPSLQSESESVSYLSICSIKSTWWNAYNIPKQYSSLPRVYSSIQGCNEIKARRGQLVSHTEILVLHFTYFLLPILHSLIYFSHSIRPIFTFILPRSYSVLVPPSFLFAALIWETMVESMYRSWVPYSSPWSLPQPDPRAGMGSSPVGTIASRAGLLGMLCAVYSLLSLYVSRLLWPYTMFVSHRTNTGTK
jgi:hypothetical protein